LPTIVFRPVPGQEKENASYLADKKLVYITQSLTELKNVAHQLLTKTGEINRMKQSLSSVQKLPAAEIVVSDILHEIEQQQGEIRISYEN
jgi:processive 1,2-diacylglycerol beta-glucosyltransferase